MIALRHACVALCGIALSALPASWHGSLGQPAAPPGEAVAPPVRVMTDTPEYCATLARRIDREQTGRMPRPPMPAGAALLTPTPLAEEVTLLTAEGRRMCDHGLIVGGIARLRRAWMLLHPRD